VLLTRIRTPHRVADLHTKQDESQSQVEDVQSSDHPMDLEEALEGGLFGDLSLRGKSVFLSHHQGWSEHQHDEQGDQNHHD